MTEITVEEFKSIENTVTLVDVREDYEYQEGYIPGAINIPLTTLAENVKRFNMSDKFYLVCRTDRRSRQAAAFLERSGVSCTIIIGGTDAYAAKYPLKK